MQHQRTARATLVALVAGLLVTLCLPIARAEGPSATVFAFDGVLGADGRLSVTQTLTFDAAPDELVQRIATKQRIDDSSHFSYDVSDIHAAIGGNDVDAQVSTEGDYVVVKIDTTTAIGSDVVISYNVLGATRTEESSSGALTVMTWRVLQGLSVAVEQVSGQVRVPAVPELVDCTAGPPGTPDKCDLYAAGTTESPMPNFQTAPRGQGEQVSFTVGVAADAVEPTAVVVSEWSLDRAFALTPLTAAIALGVLLLGAALIWQLHRRTGMDDAAQSVAAPVGTFRPVGAGESVFDADKELRPGLVGTVADERVDPVDVTATLLDLAVRGHLLITELPRAEHGLLDWSLARTGRDESELFDYERIVVSALSAANGQTLVSELPATLAPVVADVQSSLYDEVVHHGWFESRPDATRNQWRTRGFIGTGIAIALAFALVAWTNLGLLALVLLALAAALVWVSDRMPRRTAKGSQLVAGLGALSSLLATHPTSEMPAGREINEISKLLPYAIVLGGKNRWLEAMVLADEDDQAPDPTTIDWYHAPATWHLQDLPVSLTQFVNTVQGL
ncbi:MAG: DUF2207 domain-containing protein, partial [Propionibacteriaceae bacterium]|nr:DUF2207 domain-containing protein [Propionibacteriaceae bacterium]